MNRHDGSGIVTLAFSVSLAFICKHSRWRTREMTLLLFILIRRRRRLQRNQGRRRLWVRGVFLKRKNQGEFGNLVRELRASDRKLYFRYVEMSIISCSRQSIYSSLIRIPPLKFLVFSISLHFNSHSAFC